MNSIMRDDKLVLKAVQKDRPAAVRIFNSFAYPNNKTKMLYSPRYGYKIYAIEPIKKT
jgi:hypothetical protein